MKVCTAVSEIVRNPRGHHGYWRIDSSESIRSALRRVTAARGNAKVPELRVVPGYRAGALLNSRTAGYAHMVSGVARAWLLICGPGSKSRRGRAAVQLPGARAWCGAWVRDVADDAYVPARPHPGAAASGWPRVSVQLAAGTTRFSSRPTDSISATTAAPSSR